MNEAGEQCVPFPILSTVTANSSEFCRAAVRNMPPASSSPAFVAWPLTAEHVAVLMRFADVHSLCTTIAGTGHDASVLQGGTEASPSV